MYRVGGKTKKEIRSTTIWFES